jgi:hypothetical protein
MEITPSIDWDKLIIFVEKFDFSHPLVDKCKSNLVRQVLSLYFRFYKVTMLESTNATGEGRM